MGDAYVGLDRDTEAVVAYKKAVALKPDYADAFQKLNEKIESVWYFRTLTERGSPYVEGYRSLGLAHHQLKRYAEAIVAYKKAITLKSDDAFTYCVMGDSYRNLDQYTEAVAAYKQAIALKPDYEDAYFLMGIAHLGQRDYIEAIVAYKQAIALKPDHADVYYYMGYAYREAKLYTEAIGAYEQFLRLKPTGDLADSVRKDLPNLRRLAGK